MTYPPIPDTFADAPASRVILVPPDSSALIATIAKKSDEQLDYDFVYTRWLARTDAIISVTASVAPQDPSVAIAGTQVDPSGAIVKVWLQGGIGGMRYTVKVTATTAQGRVSEQIIVLSIVAERRPGGDIEALADSAAASAMFAAESALAAANSVVDTDANAAEAAQSATAAGVSQAAAGASALAAHNSDVAAGQHAAAAALSETNAGQSAGQASTSAGAASGSAGQASNSATLAQAWASQQAGLVGGIDYSARYYAAAASTSAGSASASKDGAATSATNAGNSATLAQQWAVAAGLVGGVDYSAKYYANAAAISAANAAAAFGNALARAANLSDVADAAAARGNLSAAKSGANSDITGLSALTGGITQKAAAGPVTNTMSSPAGSVRTTLVQTANANRWQWGVDSTAEGGANAGSKFFISRYSDAGALIDNPVVIDRATGAATFSVRPIFAGQTPYDTGNFNPAAYLPLTARAATSSKLFISGTGDASFAWAGQGGQPTWLFGSNDGINCYIWNPSNFSVNWANSSNYANSAGSVGGVSTPAKSVGNLFSFQWDGGSGNVNITVDSTFVAYVHANVSDARLKENIKPATLDSLALFEQIEFKEFDFKTGRHVKTGFIAQDVEKFASHWIQAHDNGQFEDARFTNEQAMLFDAMHAIQQLSKRLKALEDQYAATERKTP